MKMLASFVLVLAAAYVPARAETAAGPDADPRAWAASVARQIPAEELESALSAKAALDGPDPLAQVAARHGLQAPAWLKALVAQQGDGATLAALGDSVTAASYSCPGPYCVSNSWSVGDMDGSVRRRLETASGRPVRGLIVAVPGVEVDVLPAEAFAVYLASFFGLNVERMTLLIGHNDPGVCRPDKPGEEDRFARSVALTLDILGRVARRRHAKLFVSGLMEVDALTRYADVVPAGAAASCRELWTSTGRCKDLLQRRGEPARLQAARERIAEDDETLSRLSAGRSWVFYSGALNASSRAGIPDPRRDLSSVDCFHPSAAGQSSLAATAWNGGAGEPGVADFFALAPAAPLAYGAEPRFSVELSRELGAWPREVSPRTP